MTTKLSNPIKKLLKNYERRYYKTSICSIFFYCVNCLRLVSIVILHFRHTLELITKAIKIIPVQSNTPRTEPKITPNQSTKPVIIKPVTIRFHNDLNGNNRMFSASASLIVF